MKSFTSIHKVFNSPPEPISLEELRKIYPEFFIELILNLKKYEEIESDFRIIKRIA